MSSDSFLLTYCQIHHQIGLEEIFRPCEITGLKGVVRQDTGSQEMGIGIGGSAVPKSVEFSKIFMSNVPI